MRLYLDNCCYNRPYDSQSSFCVSMETRAKLHIQEEINKGKYEEGFDYTKWQREYFGSKSKEELDNEMDEYFSAHPYSGDPAKVI